MAGHLAEALQVLADQGLPRVQQNERIALCLQLARTSRHEPPAHQPSQDAAKR